MARNSGSNDSMRDGAGPIKGPYYPKKGGSSSNQPGKANDAWTPKQADKITKRDPGNFGDAPRAGQYTPYPNGDKSSTVTRQSVWKVQQGANGPDGSAGGTDHSGAKKPTSDRKPTRGNYDPSWPKGDTTPYGSKNTGKLK